MGKFMDWLLGTDVIDKETDVSDAEFEVITDEPRNGLKKGEQDSKTGATIEDAINFVAELRNYYYSDIMQMQSDLAIKADLPESRIKFVKKKILQEQIAQFQIDELMKTLQELERSYQQVWRKSIYSFYNDIERVKLQEAQRNVYAKIVSLNAINTKPELNATIIQRLCSYRSSWNITDDISIPINYNAILVGEADGIEEYHFSGFKKFVKPAFGKQLTPRQIQAIRNVEFEFESPVSTESVWVLIGSSTRAELNSMRRTCIIGTHWEYEPDLEGKLRFDIVPTKQLENYLRGILQIILSRTTYAIITIIIPSENMKRIIGPTYQYGSKVVIKNRFHFIYRERSGIYGSNLVTARIDRRYIPERVHFVPFTDFKKAHF